MNLNNLKVSKLSFYYGQHSVVQEVDFCVSAGEVFTLVGANGSGKSTLLRLIAGILLPEAGTIHLPNKGAFKHLTAYLGHKDGLHPNLSAFDNLNLDLGHDLDKSAVIKQLKAWGLDESLLYKPHASLSQGQRKRVAFAVLQAKHAKVWLLDEPMHNLDPLGRKLVENAISGHIKSGGIVVQTQHEIPVEYEYFILNESVYAPII